jgi:anti-sigma regulatory factor (Ser/Thr protein kinase)
VISVSDVKSEVRERRQVWRLREDARGVGQARDLVRRALTSFGLLSSVVEDAVLMVSELATNALRYGRAPYELVIRFEPGEIVCAIVDSGPILPVMRTPTLDEERGRGMRIVSALSEGRYGCRPWLFAGRSTLIGKGTWFAIPWTPRPGAPARVGDEILAGPATKPLIGLEYPAADIRLVTPAPPRSRALRLVDPRWHLERLATELERHGVVARIRQQGRQPVLSIVAATNPALLEQIFVAPDIEGGLAFHFSWPERIGSVADPGVAATRIRRVLAEQPPPPFDPGPHLERLAAELNQRDSIAQIHHQQGRQLTLSVTASGASATPERIFVAHDLDGELAFYFSWPERIGPVADARAAATRAERLLAITGRQAEAASPSTSSTARVTAMARTPRRSFSDG